MPTLRIQTNVQVPAEARADLMRRASSTAAEMLGKPESYVMILLEDERDMRFAGTPEPTAYLELKSLGLNEQKTPEYSRTLCALIEETLGIPPARIYIEMASPPRHMFGWNSGTF